MAPYPQPVQPPTAQQPYPQQSYPQQNYYQPLPGQASYPAYPPSDNSVIDTLVPSHNPKALISYYLGIFSILPIIGLVMGIIAVVLGIQGLKQAKLNPNIRGKTHAWVGIITGGIFGGLWLALTILMLVSILNSHAS